MATPLGIAEVKSIFREKSVPGRKKLLAKFLDIPDFDEDDDLRTAILLDIHYNNLSFAVEDGFPWSHVCVFFDMTRRLLDNIQEESLPKSLSLFKEELQKCAAFSEDSLKSLVDFVFLTFFQHYKLYQYVLTQNREENRKSCVATIEPPLAAMSMLEAIPKHEWDEKQKLKEIDEMEEKQRKEREAYYCQQMTEAAKQLEEPYNELTSGDQPVSKERLGHIIKNVAAAQASVTETLLQETLDEVKDSLEYQYMRANITAEYHDEAKTNRRKSDSSSSKSKRRK